VSFHSKDIVSIYETLKEMNIIHEDLEIRTWRK